MTSPPRLHFRPVNILKQRGVALFFALISLLVIMLAAAALVRSVDTSALISGNLAFQQAASLSGDSGTESAIALLVAMESANSGKNVLTDPNHPFNQNNAAAGYYASTDPNLSLTASSGANSIKWDDTDSVLLPTDSSGNTTRFVIQRLCRTAGVAVRDANCLFSGAIQNTNKQNILLPQEVCSGPGCPTAGQTPQIRVTSRTTGPRNTLNYVQAFVY
jgi:Tfp pilus assembly protein PilX